MAGVDAEPGVEQEQPACGRLDLGPANVALLEDDLTVQIRDFHILVVDQSNPTHAGRGEVERDR